MDSADDSKQNFFKHVFNFDDNSKSEIMNIIQYALIAIIPVVALNKTLAKYVPEADNNKGSVEIIAEIVIQALVMFIGLLIIHRMVTFVPTYSNEKYPDFNVVFIILAVLMITLSLQTKLGEKVNIIVERLQDLWEGKTDNKKIKSGKSNSIKISQPISGQITGQMMNNAAITQSLYSDGTAIGSLPTTTSDDSGSQQLPNYNAMYKQDTTPLISAATPGMSEGFSEPMAANAVLGGSGFGSSW
jgi:hypothetical protein